MMRTFIAFLGIVTLVAGCQLLGFEGSDDTDDQREKWSRQHDGDYSYVLNRGCFCALGGPFWVQVVDYEVAAAIQTYSQEPVDSTQLEYIETIEDLFDLIDRAREEHADDLHVEYAPEGYPAVVNVDWYEHAVDDEMFMSVSEVVIGVSNPD